MSGSSMLGGGNECKEFGGCDGNPAAEEVGGGREEESGSTTGGELGSAGGASGRLGPASLPSLSGTFGKYPPSDVVRSAVDESNGDTSGGAALW